MSQVPSFRRALRVLALVVAAAACGRPAEQTATGRKDVAPVLTVARRLTAHDFRLGAAAPPHRSVIKIGDEARTVALAPRMLDVATLRGLPLEDGKLRRDLDLPAEARELPANAFRIDAQLLSITADLAPEVFELFATETFHAPVDTQWTLTPDASRPGGAVLDLGIVGEARAGRLNLDVRALLAQPASVTSVAFDVPRGASIALGYGLLATSGAATRYRAALRCGSVETALLDETVTPPDATWHGGSHDLPPGRGCTLRLDTSTADGGDVRAATWAEPLILAPQPAGPEPAAENVIVVSLDTLRADHLSGYGYPRPTSPTIDARLIRGGTTFTDVSTSFPRTDVAHLSLFTGLYPDAQPELGRLRATATAALMTESLRDAGLVTAGFTEDAMIAGAFGFWFGFDRFVERSYAERERGRATFADGIEFLRQNADRRFFLFLHTYKTHKPYVASERFDAFAPASDWQTLPLDRRVPPGERAQMDAYDRTIREADDLIASLLAELDRLGITERTLVVLLSDHGEAFGEHGAVEHGYAGHQEQLHIPLVFRGPGIPAGTRVDAPASIVDVAPTVLALADAAPLPDAQGISLADAFADHDLPRHRPLFFSYLAKGAQGVRHGPWKYLRADHGHELFDLASDPGEDLPRLRKRAARAVDAALLSDYLAESAALRDRLRGAGAPKDGAGDAPIDGRMQDSLRALGYVQ
jgi:arylsulfatase A-like enzyme